MHYENAKTIAILKLQTPKYHFSELLIIVVLKRILAQRIAPLQIVHDENVQLIAILKLQTPKYHFSESLIIVVVKRIAPLQIVHYENAQPIAILKLHPTKNTIFGIVDYCIAATHFAAIFLHKYIFLTFNV